MSFCHQEVRSSKLSEFILLLSYTVLCESESRVCMYFTLYSCMCPILIQDTIQVQSVSVDKLFMGTGYVQTSVDKLFMGTGYVQTSVDKLFMGTGYVQTSM